MSEVDPDYQIVNDVDYVACYRCGTELHPGFLDRTTESEPVCRDCLSDIGAEDRYAEQLGYEEQSRQLIDDGLLSPDATQSFSRNCACCGYYFEPQFGMRSLFGTRLCARCEAVKGFWGSLFARSGGSL